MLSVSVRLFRAWWTVALFGMKDTSSTSGLSYRKWMSQVGIL